MKAKYINYVFHFSGLETLKGFIYRSSINNNNE